MIATRTLVLAGVAALFPVLAMAQVNSTNQGYLVNGPNFDVVTAVGGTICVRTSDWTPARAAAAKACQQCTPELCPKPVAVAQAPAAPARPATPAAPPAKKAPEKMLPQKINFSADALFDFDKAVLKPEGKAMLDELARTLQGANYEVIVTVGHADRFGSVSYNQKLSERRAAAVKDYLMSKDIPANKISTDGKGKSQPMTKPGECAGPKSAKVIACLQPDRRVDVDVTGSK
ncbi:MAG: OmpA family protein [Betaproteobacteria bacterium]|nr:OmpA family protein [Betaproteobacteria bacterium]